MGDKAGQPDVPQGPRACPVEVGTHIVFSPVLLEEKAGTKRPGPDNGRRTVQSREVMSAPAEAGRREPGLMLFSSPNAGLESPATEQALGFCCCGWVVWFLFF